MWRQAIRTMGSPLTMQKRTGIFDEKQGDMNKVSTHDSEVYWNTSGRTRRFIPPRIGRGCRLKAGRNGGKRFQMSVLIDCLIHARTSRRMFTVQNDDNVTDDLCGCLSHDSPIHWWALRGTLSACATIGPS